MTDFFFNKKFPGTREAMSPVVDHAVDALTARGWVADQGEFALRLAIEEALTNAVRHGSNGDARRKVRITMAEEGDECRIYVHDHGKGFRLEDVKPPAPDQPGGRGLMLIRHYMDAVSYDQQAHRLCMTMRRRTD